MSDPADLRSLPLFEACSPEELALAARLLTPIDASPGRILMSQGGPAQQFVAVESGEVTVIHASADRADHVVTLGPGDHVGEVGLLDHVPCTATVLTRGGARVHVANAGEFRQLLDVPAVAEHLRSIADDRLAENELVDAG